MASVTNIRAQNVTYRTGSFILLRDTRTHNCTTIYTTETCGMRIFFSHSLSFDVFSGAANASSEGPTRTVSYLGPHEPSHQFYATEIRR